MRARRAPSPPPEPRGPAAGQPGPRRPGQGDREEADRHVDVEHPAPRWVERMHERPAIDPEPGEGRGGMDAREHRGPDERPRGHAEERERADDAERPGPGVAL